MQQYHRRIKLQVYFQNKNDKTFIPFTHKSEWSPPLSQLPPEITHLVQADINYFDNNFQALRVKKNLNQDEIKALKELKDNKNIIIKPADKDSAVVLMERKQYLFEGNRQLKERKYYLVLKEPIYPETASQTIFRQYRTFSSNFQTKKRPTKELLQLLEI